MKSGLDGFFHVEPGASAASFDIGRGSARTIPQPKKTERADALLVSRGLCDSREQAKRLILAGEVRSGHRVIDKPNLKLVIDAPLEIKEKPKFVGRGGLKLEGASRQVSAAPDAALDELDELEKQLAAAASRIHPAPREN